MFAHMMVEYATVREACDKRRRSQREVVGDEKLACDILPGDRREILQRVSRRQSAR